MKPMIIMYLKHKIERPRDGGSSNVMTDFNFCNVNWKYITAYASFICSSLHSMLFQSALTQNKYFTEHGIKTETIETAKWTTTVEEETV